VTLKRPAALFQRLAASVIDILGAASAANDPVLFGGNGGTGAQSLWNVVENDGSTHRD
jgi:hypothetical protein